ncbi:MAG: hypothetical protein ABI851_05295 [Saprospiraceae bacterium]
MRNKWSYFILIAVLNILLFGTVFKLLQNDQIYQHTLGLISENYERIGKWDNFEIKQVSKPYTEFNNENFINWDGAIYKCISEKMYTPDKECFGSVRASFFPLFPFLWKITFSTPISISIINYLLFVISIALLINYFLSTARFEKLLLFGLLISLPSSIIYYLPYTESLFLITTTIASIGIIKNNYRIYFIGSLLLSLVRPATVFVLIAILIVEFILFIRNKNLKLFSIEIAKRSLPFILGYFFIFLIQFCYTGNWNSMFESQKSWYEEFKAVRSITDYSIEGFGLSTFSIFYFCIPCIIFAAWMHAHWKKPKTISWMNNINEKQKEYLLAMSMFYIIGIFIFTLTTSNGNMRSFSRFTLASPAFYIVILYFINYLVSHSNKIFVWVYFIMTILTFIFLYTVDYGGSRVNFSYFGLYMFMITGLFLLFIKLIPENAKIIISILIIIANTLWNTFLLNSFLSNAWIFT